MNYYLLSILIPFQLSHLLQYLFLDFVLNIKTGLSTEKKKCSCDFIYNKTKFLVFFFFFYIYFICIIYPRLRNDRGLVLLQFLLCECNSFYVEVYVLWTSKVNLLFILERSTGIKWNNLYGRFKVGLFYIVFVSTKVKFRFRCCLFPLEAWMGGTI